MCALGIKELVLMSVRGRRGIVRKQKHNRRSKRRNVRSCASVSAGMKGKHFAVQELPQTDNTARARERQKDILSRKKRYTRLIALLVCFLPSFLLLYISRRGFFFFLGVQVSQLSSERDSRKIVSDLYLRRAIIFSTFFAFLSQKKKNKNVISL